MSPVDAFHLELVTSSNAVDSEVLLPDRIARACVAVLPFDGAGLSMTLLPDRRLPLGSSDSMAALAERLQFALGEGPCTTSQREHAPVLAMDGDLTVRWPVYAGQLTTHTPYRMTLSLPVGGPLTGAVVLDLYRRRSGRPSPGVLETAADIAAAGGTVLAGATAGDGELVLGLPPVLRTPAVRARQQVWLAIGHTAVALQASSPDALAALRAIAFTHDTDLETIAERIVTGDIDLPAELDGFRSGR